MKLPDWGLTTAVVAWCDGSDFEELEEIVELSPGDLCRSFRMAVQLMRQVRRAIDPAWDLHGRLEDAVRALDGLLEEGLSGEVYNVCSGSARSLGTVARLMAQAAGVAARFEPMDNPDPMASSVWAGDVQRLQDTLGWVPAPMGEDGIRDLL